MGSDLGMVTYYKNTGTTVTPAFTLMTDSLPIRSEGFFNCTPAFADLDGNGTQDLLLGTYYKDSVFYFRNIGTPTDFNFQ